MLEVLVAAEGGVVSAEELLERAWDEHANPFTNAVRITVSALRKRLGEPWLIATVAGVGYRIDTAETPEAREAIVDRAPGLSVRLKLTLSYAGFLMVAGVLLLATVWVFLLRYVPELRSCTASLPSFPPLRPSGRFRSAGSRCVGVPARVRSRGGWILAGRMLAPLTRITDATRRAGTGHSPTGSSWKAAKTSSANSPTPSTSCSLGSTHARRTTAFAANASHELRTPLAITQTLLDVVRNDPTRGPDVSMERLHVVNARAIHLTEALLLLSRTDQRPSPENLSTCPSSRKKLPKLSSHSQNSTASHPDFRGHHPDHRLTRAVAADDHEPRA